MSCPALNPFGCGPVTCVRPTLPVLQDAGFLPQRSQASVLELTVKYMKQMRAQLSDAGTQGAYIGVTEILRPVLRFPRPRSAPR